MRLVELHHGGRGWFIKAGRLEVWAEGWRAEGPSFDVSDGFKLGRRFTVAREQRTLFCAFGLVSCCVSLVPAAAPLATGGLL